MPINTGSIITGDVLRGGHQAGPPKPGSPGSSLTDPVPLPTPWPWGIGTVGPTAPEVERTIAVSGTILDWIIPMVYGTATVGGRIGAWQYNSGDRTLDLGVIFAFGEQNSIATATTYLNGEAITSAIGVTAEAVHDGDGSTALSAVLTGMTEWVAADTTKWKSYAHCVLTIDCQTSQLPGSFVFTSKLGGRKCVPIAGGAAAVTENLAVVGWDIMTSSDWAGNATSKLNTTSWQLFESWCGETMGDATKRYEFNGSISERDPDRALALVLGHGLAYSYVGVDGKLALWAEMAPAAITGDWSATASATITEDAAGGAAVADLDVDDYVYVGTNLRRVSSITDDDTVVLDSVVTVSGVAVRPISNIYLKKRHWVQPPAASESNLLQTPDKYRVRFVDEDNAGSHMVTATYGAGTDKIIETTLASCASASVATRHAETVLKVAHLQPYSWAGVVGNNVGTAAQPGDVLLFDDDVLTMQPARVLPPIQARADGTYVLQLREYDPSAYSDNTAVTDTVPSLGTGYDTSQAPVVTTLNTVYSGTEYAAVSMGQAGIYDGRVVVGDTSRNTVLGSSDVRLPNNIPIYGLNVAGGTVEMLKVDNTGAGRLVLGDGSVSLFLNAGGAGTQILLPADVDVVSDWTNKRRAFVFSGANVTFSSTAGTTTIAGSQVIVDPLNDFLSFNFGDNVSQFYGILQGTGSIATTTELPNDGDFCIWEETDTNIFSWCFNDAATIRQIT